VWRHGAIEAIDAAYICAAEDRHVSLPLDTGYDIDAILEHLGRGARIAGE
jgi:hypothetical protein